MSITKQSYTVAAANLTGHASNVTGASWTIATTTASDGLAHYVTVRNDSVTDHSAKTILLTGTGANGETVTETINAPGTSATVTSTKPFKTLTSAVPSATIGADTFDIGWAATAVSPWIDTDYNADNFNVSVAVDAGGTINYDVQHTYSVTAYGNPDYANAVAFNHSSLAAKTADAYGAHTSPVAAVRVNVNSHTSGTFSVYVAQAD